MRKLLTMVTTLGLVLLVSPVLAGQVTNLGKVKLSKTSVKKSIPSEVRYVFNRDIAQGRLKKTSQGEDGEKLVVTEQVRNGQKLVSSKTHEDIIREAKPTIIEMGKTGFQTSRGAFSRSKVMTVEATAYTPYDGSSTGHTATGRKAAFGVIAVDPRVIPLNSLVYVEGYGFAVAADTGGAIKGNRIDVCFPQQSKVNNWGRKKVTIHVFKEKVKKGE